ncbi:MAG: transglycosylase domain-containing protein, partial [Actinomycetaceae bacterium]|nr:transglycosylase domain-containing protein [Actinomycetaceae bacterium]
MADKQTPSWKNRHGDSTKPSGLPSRRSIHRKSSDAASNASAPPPARQRTDRQPGAISGNKKPLSTSAGGQGRKTTANKDRKKPSWPKRIGMGFLFLVLIGIIVGAVGFLVAYASIKVPAPGEFALSQKTVVYYSDGETELGTFSDIERTIIDTTTLPQHVGDAVVASEDRTFYTNSGIDIKGIGRALLNNLTGGQRQGGSTLSQQYIERYYLDTTTGYLGKAKEAILALKINRQQTKQEILGNYLNTIYFGRGAYGIEEAAQKYFGHPATELTLSESALLAGIIPAPSLWDPAVDETMAKQRWTRVLDLMATDGAISQEEADSAEFPEVIEANQGSSMSGTTGYVMQQIRAELNAQANLSDQDIDTGGLKIVSTIDKTKQDAAIAAVAALPDDHAENLRVALSSIDPATGEIVAEYAGRDYQQIQSNAVTQDRAMAGSTFKPFGLLAYIETGGTLDDVYNGNSQIQIVDNRTGEVSPALANFGNVSYGDINLTRATALSVNTAYVEMNNEMGPNFTRQTAIKLGIPEDTVGLDDTLRNILGSTSPHNIDLTRAYATLASGGIRTTPHIVRSVARGNGSLIYEAATTAERVVSAEDVSAIMPALQAAAQWGSAEKASALGRPVVAKTGSSENNRSAQFAGSIPQLATVVSMYQPGADGSEESITPFGGEVEITGSTWPGTVWRDYMVAATADMEVKDFDWIKNVQRTSKYKPAPTPEPEPEPSPTPTPTPTPT